MSIDRGPVGDSLVGVGASGCPPGYREPPGLMEDLPMDDVRMVGNEGGFAVYEGNLGPRFKAPKNPSF